MLIIQSSGQQKQDQNIKHTEGTGVRGPHTFTSVDPFLVSEFEEDSFGTMIIVVKCKLECG